MYKPQLLLSLLSKVNVIVICPNVQNSVRLQFSSPYVTRISYSIVSEFLSLNEGSTVGDLGTRSGCLLTIRWPIS